MGEPTVIGTIVGVIAAVVGLAVLLTVAARRKPSFNVKIRRTAMFTVPMRSGDARARESRLIGRAHQEI